MKLLKVLCVVALCAALTPHVAHAQEKIIYGSVAPPAAGMHPRICLTPSEVPLLRERVKSGPAKIGLDKSRRLARELLDEKSAVAILVARLEKNENPTDAERQKLSGAIREAAFVSLVEGDALQTAAAKRALLAFAGGVAPDTKGIDYSRNAPGIAFGYDFLFDALSPDERETVRIWLARTGDIWAADLENQVYGFKPGAEKERTFNWIPFITGGFGITALAIEGEAGYKPEWFQKAARAHFDYLQHGIGSEGAPDELVWYFGYGMVNGTYFLDAMARRGQAVWNHPHLQNVPLFWANDQLPWAHGDFNSLADTRDIVSGPHEIFHRLALAWPQNRVMQWVYGQVTTNANTDVLAPMAQALWAQAPDTALRVEDLQLPPGRFFAANGLTYARSGWNAGDTYLEFQSDPKVAGPSHAHADRNAFTLMGAERIWAMDAGLYFPHDIGHNLVFIDGRAQGFFPHFGRIVAQVESGWAAGVLGDAKKAYDWQTEFESQIPAAEKAQWRQVDGLWSKPYQPVERAFRSAVLVRGAHPYAMICDDIQKDAQPHQYAWQMLSPLGNRFDLSQPNTALAQGENSAVISVDASVAANKRAPHKVLWRAAQAGRYRVWLLMGRDYWTSWTWGGELSLDGSAFKRFFAREGDNAHAHWQAVSEAFEATAGEHSIELKPVGETRFHALLVAPESFDATAVDEAAFPPQSTLRRLGEGEIGAGWKRVDAAANPPQLQLKVLWPPQTKLEAEVFNRVRPDKAATNRVAFQLADKSAVLRLSATTTTVAPNFRVFLYPHRAGAPLPQIQSNQSGATLTWPDGTIDEWTFGRTADFAAKNGAGVRVRRSGPNGAKSFELDG